jgi:hypothetical protein
VQLAKKFLASYETQIVHYILRAEFSYTADRRVDGNKMFVRNDGDIVTLQTYAILPVIAMTNSNTGKRKHRHLAIWAPHVT